MKKPLVIAFRKYTTSHGLPTLCNGPETSTEGKSESVTDHGGYILWFMGVILWFMAVILWFVAVMSGGVQEMLKHLKNFM